jgi:ASC-1-like (ASCH) protein
MAALDYVILFHPSLVSLIKDGTKNLTYRLDDDGLDYLKVGDLVKAENSATGETFAELEIVSLAWTTFGDLPTDREGNVKSESKEKQREVFEGYYSREVTNYERVLIIGFSVVHWLGEN